MSADPTPSGALRACAVSDVPEEGAIRVELAGQPVCIARSGGSVYAISDICSHADVALSEGDVEDGKIECWLHGSMFDLATGEPTGLPATRPVPTFPVTVEGENVLVEMES
jgi:3-phenylpropionate/trans-cinnamate dioxygenase ferredoxin subunit